MDIQTWELYPSSHKDREIKGGKESLQLTAAFVQPKSRAYASASAINISIPSYAVAPVLNGAPRDYNPPFPSSLSAVQGRPGLDNSPSSFFIPVPGGASSGAPSSSSSPAASSFDFSSLHKLDGLFAGPSSCPSQSHSSDSSCDNSSSADRPTRKRRLTVVPPPQDLDWVEHDLEILGHGPLSSGSVFDGSQYPGYEARDLQSVPIERYSWLNEELAVRVFIPLPGVHKLPAKCIQVTFETESFDVTVRNPAQGIQHKLAFQQLYGEIVPQDCTYEQRSDKLVIKLIKVPGRMDAYNKGRPLEWFALKFD